MNDTLWRSRRYSPIEGQQQRIDRAVSSWDEIARAVEEAVNAQLPLSLRLATDIEVDRPITFPFELPAVDVTGANRTTLLAVAPLTSMFVVDCARTTLSGFGIQLTPSGTLPVVFSNTRGQVGTKNLVLRDLAIEGSIVSGAPTYLLDPLCFWTTGSMVGCTLNAAEYPPQTVKEPVQITSDPVTSPYAGISYWRFVDVQGSIKVLLAGNSIYNFFVAVGSPGNTGTYDGRSGSGATGNTCISCLFRSYLVNDYDAILCPTSSVLERPLTRLPAGLSTPPVQPTLSAASPTIGALSYTYVRPSFGAGVTGTISLAAGAQLGQIIILEPQTTATGGGVLPASGAGASLQSDWAPSAGSTLTLIWNGTTWVEIARGSSASGATPYRGDVTTTDATATTIVSIPTATNRAYFVTLDIIGRRTNGTGESGAYKVFYKAKNVAGTVSVSAATVAFRNEDDSTWLDPVLAVVGTSLRASVTGAASQTINWRCVASVRDI